MVRRPGPQEDFVGGFLLGPAFLGGQAFPQRQAVLGEAFLSPPPVLPDGRRCFWSIAAKPSCPTWGAAELSSSLSEGMLVLEAVGPSLVEKVRVPKSRVLPMCREWDKASGPDVKVFGVQRLRIFQWGDMRFIVISRRAHPVWSTYLQPGTAVCYLVPLGGGGIQHGLHLRRIPFG
jgi:hypothetical protein